MNNEQVQLQQQADELARLLSQRRVRVVFAESCTAGLVSATLARVPGISDWHCGSAVTYRTDTKRQWLDVSAEDLRQFTAVSEPVAAQMAVGVLARTPEADYAASVTGHLGPDAPEELDGVIYIGIAGRAAGKPQNASVCRYQLQSTERVLRQQEAAALTLERLATIIRDDT
jgi:PncC family amidohydrolase